MTDKSKADPGAATATANAGAGAATATAGAGAGAAKPALGFRLDAGAAAPPPAKDGAQAPPAGGPEAGKPPRFIEYNGEKIEVPPELWDEETGAVNALAAVKRATDLRRQLGEQPPIPETYEVKAPSAFKDKWEIKADDPNAQRLVALAKEKKWPQDTVDAIVGLKAKLDIDAQAALEAEVAKEMETEWKDLEKDLGGADRAKSTVADLNKWLSGMVVKEGKPDPHMVQAATLLMAHGHGVRFLLNLRERMGRSGLPAVEAQSAANALSLADLRALQASPEYLAGDPATHRKVQEGYIKLYGA